MHIIPLIPVAIVASLWQTVTLADHVIRQRGRVFSVRTLFVSRGEPVEFVNDDTVPHNIMSSTAGNAFDLGSQLPGTATPVVFSSDGVVEVICAIHPRMRLTIQVGDVAAN